MPSEPSSSSNPHSLALDEALGDRCRCGHTRFRHQGDGEVDGHCRANCPCKKYDFPKVEDVKPSDCQHEEGCAYLLTNACARGCRAAVEGLVAECQEYRRNLHEPCQHPNAEYLGSISGAGEPKTKRYRCPDCNERYQVQEPEESGGHVWEHLTPESGLRCLRCTLAHKDWSGDECPAKQADFWLCDDCGSSVPGHLDWCPQPDCEAKAQEALAEDAPPQPERRPPYAVAYSAGGHAYEVLLPGDARAEAVDGRLIIEHPGLQVLGIVRVQPVRTESSDG
ncbi:hypothetical protein ACGF5F_29710 [Streptomyces sp. NPDC047821]|uniref:hypothetical protein n=1 Tax=Streptomyces sp. NPDC047821 TaxID=3365488 RepID=UPI003723A20B